jgi:hypothetical protein
VVADDPADDFLDDFDDGGYLAALDPPHRDPETGVPDLPEKAQCSRHLFSSQDTPEAAAFTEDQTARPDILSPNTLHKVATQAIREGVPPTLGKKARKRSKKGAPASSCQPAPTKPVRVQDKVPIMNWRTYHVAGQPILPQKLLKTLTGDMRSLHDSVLTVEQRLLGMSSPSYPVFMAKVPKGMGFVDGSPGDMFFLRFDDIFDMFHMKRLHHTLVCLVTLSYLY